MRLCKVLILVKEKKKKTTRAGCFTLIHKFENILMNNK